MHTKKRKSKKVLTAQPWRMKHSALAYANQWFVTDKGFMSSLKDPAAGHVDPEVLGKLAAKYMVARGFKKKGEGETPLVDERWKLAAASLATAARCAEVHADDIHRLAEQLGRVSPRKGTSETLQLSAATKFLWFCGKHEVRILDARAVDALIGLGAKRSVRNVYASYLDAWDAQFKLHKESLNAAIEELPDRLDWSCIPADEHENAKRVINQSWFADRVFDKYLWTIGANPDGGATSFT